MTVDLTTKEGMEKAIKICKSITLMSSFPSLYLANKIIDLFSSKDIIKEQRKVAKELIKAGYKNNVDEINIELDQKAGINIENEIKDVPIKVSVGNNNKMKLQIKYK